MRGDEDENAPVPLFGPPDEGDEPPRRHDLERCRNCLEPLRDDAAYCDRCGARQDAPRRAAESAGAPWPVILLVGLLIGVLIGGAVALSFVSSRIARLEAEVARVDDARSEIAALRREVLESARAREVVYVEPDEPVREPVSPAPPPAPEAETEPVVLDSSNSGLRARFGASIFELRALDANGDELDVAPGFACGERRVVSTLSTISGAAALVLVDSAGAEHSVTGIAGHDIAFDLAVLEVAEPLKFVPLAIPFSPLETPADHTLLGAVSRKDWRETTVRIVPGQLDRISGSPRLGVEPAARFPGVAIDREGRVIALLPQGGAVAIPAYPAAPLAQFGSAAVPLDFFQRSTGPGTPSARWKRARQLLEEKKLEEAVRLMLEITREEPRLIPEVAADLSAAMLEIARTALSDGSSLTAESLLSETLQRLPEDGELWAARGRCLAVLGDVDNAVSCLRTASGKSPVRRDDFLKEAIGLVLDAAAQRKARGLVNDAIRLLLDHRRSFPGDGSIRGRAGDLLMEARRFEEAAQLFGEAALVDPEVAGEMRVKADRARDLAGGPGAIVVDFQPGEPKIVVTARLNGSTSVRLLLDSGEAHNILPSAAVAAAGYSLPSLPRMKFHTDPNRPEVPTVQVGTIVVGPSVTQRVAAVVVDDYAQPYADGVLGQPFLSRFRRVEDQTLGRLVLYPR
jgi:tetratricopeptide (TPR) repeat protein